MYKTSKWVPVIVLFLILLLCALLLFAMLGQQANANGGTGDGTSTSPSTSDQATEPPTSTSSQSGTSAEPSDSTSDVTAKPTEPGGSSTSTSGSTSDSSSDATTKPTEPPPVDLNQVFPLYNASGEKIAELTIEEYLYGALLDAISFTYEPGALAAQAIALRTDVYRRISAGERLSTETYGYTDHATLLPVWGTDFSDTIWNRVKNAVDQTKGQVLMRGNALYTFDLAGEQGVLLAKTDIGKQAKTKSATELLAIYYPSATVL